MFERMINILVAEDNKGDVMMIKEMLGETGLPFHIDVVNNGNEALIFLRSTEHRGNAKPDLLILDLNMPIMDGKEFLNKARGYLDHIYVLIFTGSLEIDEITKGLPYNKMIKPATNREFDVTVAKLKRIIQGISGNFTQVTEEGL